ncbi:MAG: TetR/AcrR family transcriptional regulator [Saprospiraceae bacterium]|nr:TetR/AcrR family transcriptional regulator [Saprospiraceae bacterium]
MEVLPSHIQLNVNQRIFLKNPESSDLGKKIISGSIDMIDEMGFESFTFRKLGQHIQSTEASIYRYFENKHRLLLYLINWYWNWIDFRLIYLIANIEDPTEKLRRAITLLTQSNEVDNNFQHVNEIKLHRIVIAESSKTYLTKEVEEENKEGLFKSFKQLVERVSGFISDVNPEFKYPHMLVSTVIEGAHHQRFFAAHLPMLTDQLHGEDSINNFYQDLVFKALKSKDDE